MNALSKLFSQYIELPEYTGVGLDSVNTVGNFGNYPLNVASSRGMPAEVTLLLENAADPNCRGELGNTPLHDAAGQNHSEVVRLLLAAGARRDTKNDFGDTPLVVAERVDAMAVSALLRRDQESSG